MGAVDRSIREVCRGPPTAGPSRTDRFRLPQGPTPRYHHRFASMRTHHHERGGSAVPAPTADTTHATDEVLAREQAHLDHARDQLRRMREATDRLEAEKATDAWTSQLLGLVLARRVASLQDDPHTTLFFGRVDMRTEHGEETFHIGRRHVSDDHGNPVVVDWRAPISTAFYRASPAEPMGVELRRRFGVDRGRLTAYEDERLTLRRRRRPQRHPRRRDRAPPLRADARHRLDHPARAGRDRAQRPRHEHLRAGCARHRQDRGRPAPGRVAALLLPRAARAVRRARRGPQPGLPRPHRRRPALAGRGAGAPRHHRLPARPRSGPGAGPHRGRDPQGRRPPRRRAAPRRLVARRPGRGGPRRAARLPSLAGARVRDPRRRRRARRPRGALLRGP